MAVFIFFQQHVTEPTHLRYHAIVDLGQRSTFEENICYGTTYFHTFVYRYFRNHNYILHVRAVLYALPQFTYRQAREN